MANQTLKTTIALLAVWCTTVALVAQTQKATSAGKVVSSKSALQAAPGQREKQGREAFKNKRQADLFSNRDARLHSRHR